MLRAMSFWSRFREKLAGPPHVQGSAEDDAALREEYSVPNAGDTEMKDIEERSEAPAGPAAVAPFAGAGQVRAAEIEDELVRPEDVRPEGAETASSDDEPPPEFEP
jgi:hypothetical protein